MVAAVLPTALMLSVNLAEVATFFTNGGAMLDEVRDSLNGLPLEIVPFDGELAYVCAGLRPATKHLGLSLGDRACLALAKREGMPALTADRRARRESRPSRRRERWKIQSRQFY